MDGKRCIVDDALSADGWMLDINAYDYDVRNIAQNATVKGNVDALDDDDNPTPIAPGELTEGSSGNSANADDDSIETVDAETPDDESTSDVTYDDYDDETYYDEGSGDNEGNNA